MILITERAVPKVNLTLRILGKRADGYHELESLVAFAQDITDTLTLRPTVAPPRVTCEGRFAHGIAGANLISVALEQIRQAAPQLTLGDVTLTKEIPVAAGIGGGSADAAAVIRAVRTLNAPASDAVDWHGVAAKVGADVPVCLASKAQVMRGLGERLEDEPDLPELAAVLVNPMVRVPDNKTAQVFKTLGAGPLGLRPPERTTPHAFADVDALLTHMSATGNDLTAAARKVVPAIDDVLAAIKASPGCRLAQLSGGGPTCFGVYRDMDAARAAATAISSTRPSWWVAATRLR